MDASSDALKVFNGINAIATVLKILSMLEKTLKMVGHWKNRTMRCPVCSSQSCPILSRSSNHSCGVRFGSSIEDIVGELVVYGECSSCGHVSTDYFDDWTHERFKDEIYNDQYHVHDPAYVERRPIATAAAVARFYDRPTKVLDYGSGSGLLTKILSKFGMESIAFDPMTTKPLVSSDKFDLLLCIEVLEHVPNPWVAAETLLRHAGRGADVVVTTLLLPEATEHENWWMGPRNGHIHAYSKASLDQLFPGMKTFSPGVHYLGSPSEGFLSEIESAVLCERD